MHFFNITELKKKAILVSLGLTFCLLPQSAQANSNIPLNRQPWYPEFKHNKDIMNNELAKSYENIDYNLVCNHATQNLNLLLEFERGKDYYYNTKYDYYSWRHEWCNEKGFNYALIYQLPRKAPQDPPGFNKNKNTTANSSSNTTANSSSNPINAFMEGFSKGAGPEVMQLLQLGGSNNSGGANAANQRPLSLSDYQSYCASQGKTYRDQMCWRNGGGSGVNEFAVRSWLREQGF